MDYQNIQPHSAAADTILALSPEKRDAIEKSQFFMLMQQVLDGTEAPYDIASLQIAFTPLLLREDATTKNLVLFTSDRREEAEKFVLDNPHHDLIHTTPMGYWLEKLRLFDKRSWGEAGTEVAYAAWNIASARLIKETQSPEITIIANPENQTSTLWMLEMLALQHNPIPQKFHVYTSSMQEEPVTLDREEILHLENPALLEWMCLMDDHITAPNDFGLYQNLIEHELADKFLKDTSFDMEELHDLRIFYVQCLKELWPDFVRELELQKAPSPKINTNLIPQSTLNI
jgi:hypothetical protein